MDPKNFFAELKRRNVYKVASRVRGYRLAADANRQPDFSIFRNPELGRSPRSSPHCIVGFPIALIIAWAFEDDAGRNQTRQKLPMQRGNVPAAAPGFTLS